MSPIATTVDNAIVDPLIKLFLCPADMQPLDITQFIHGLLEVASQASVVLQWPFVHAKSIYKSSS